MDPILSRDDTVWHQPNGSPRRYLLAPLTRRERNLFRRAMIAEGASFPGEAALFGALRDALRQLAPSNLPELLEMVDAAEAEAAEAKPGDPTGPANRALAPVEAAARAVPVFASALADRDFYVSTLPGVMARLALRGWEGEGLPPFARQAGQVPEALLEEVPDADLVSLGWRSHALTFVTRQVEKNSVPPSPSLESQAAGTES